MRPRRYLLKIDTQCRWIYLIVDHCGYKIAIGFTLYPDTFEAISKIFNWEAIMDKINRKETAFKTCGLQGDPSGWIVWYGCL